MMVEQLMNNAYVWLGLSIISVFGIIFSIYTWIANKEKKLITYSISTYEIVKAGKNIIPNIRIFYKNHDIDNLTITRFAIWNDGNRLLNSGDIVETVPLSIKSMDDGPVILDASIVKCSDESNMFKIKRKDPHCVEMGFDYIDKQDGAIVQIMHTGIASEFTVLCKIKGGRKIRNLSELEHSGPWNFLTTSIGKFGTLYIFVMCAIYVFFAIVATLAAFGVDVPNVLLSMAFFSEDITLGLAASIDMMAAIICLLSYHLINKTLHLKIPSLLRSEIEYKMK